jgi:16S rRNA processing protein RimM
VGDGVHREQRRVERARLAGTQVLLKLQGIDDRDAAEAQRGAMVEVPEREAWKLPRGRFYWHQIIGLRVRTPEGRELGTVKEILETGANDVYVVDTERGEMLVPAIKDVVKGIAPHRGVMTVEPLPGMEPEAAGRTKDGRKTEDERRRTKKRPRRRETDKPS